MSFAGVKKYIKYLMNFFNLIFLLLGLVLLALGIWGEINLGSYVELSSVNYITGARILMAVGILVLLAGVFGLWGASRESRVLLTIYLTILGVLIGLEIATAVIAFLNKDEIKQALDKDLKQSIVDYPVNAKIIDTLQSKLECCGVNDPEDWIFNTDYIKTNDTTLVPDSCCTSQYQARKCGEGQRIQQTKIYKTGCYAMLRDKIQETLVPIGVFAITILMIQIIGMSFAIYIVHPIIRRYNVNENTT